MNKKCVICNKEIINENDIEFIPADRQEDEENDIVDVLCKDCYNGIIELIYEKEKRDEFENFKLKNNFYCRLNDD